MGEMRLEIQGLRAVAVFFVLLYHLWDHVFPVGYLGVDVFFVISGFLMCSIVSKQTPMDGRKSLDFFFRRFKRLLPPYLFIVAVVLIAGIFLLAPAEFGTLANDGMNSAVFVSNYFGQGGRGYFDLYSEYKFLKHTWSLSAEVQFYVLVPLFFFFFDRFDRRNSRWKLRAIGSISFVSFLLQVISDREVGHMALQCRLWQFFFGFFAFYAHSARLFDIQRAGQQSCVEEGKEEVESQQSFHLSEHLDAFLNAFLFVSLLLILTFDLTTVDALNRLLITSVSFLIVAKSTGSRLLQLESLVSLGDISYSVYLVHWPLFTLHRYWFPEFYAHRGEHATFAVGISLIFSSIVCGYLVENAYKWAAQRLNSWPRLLPVLLVGFSLIGAAVWSLRACAPVRSYDSQMSVPVQLQTKAAIERLYSTRNSTSPLFSPEVASDLNLDVYVFSRQFYSCPNRSRHLPTRFPADLSILTSFCHDRGVGTKNIVVIGNSHGRELYHGIRHHFHDLYSEMTLFVRDYCMPFLGHRARQHMASTCVQHEQQLIPVLANWETQIDVIIVGMEYFDFYNPPFDGNRSTDEYFLQMQSFYDQLNEIARERVFIPAVHIDWWTEPFAPILQKELRFGGDFRFFRQTKKEQLSYLNHVRERVDLLSCPKCSKIDWSRAWCSNGDCRALDKRSIAFFRDSKHVNAYGSLNYGRLLRHVYDRKERR